MGLEGRALCREGREGNVLIINIQISLLQSNTLIFFFFFTVSRGLGQLGGKQQSVHFDVGNIMRS